jgi:hypothetical protein
MNLNVNFVHDERRNSKVCEKNLEKLLLASQ